MRKGAIIGIIIAVLAVALTITGFFVFSSNDLEKAIDEFEDGDYKDAILMLNHLAITADYDTGEKIYYYRCRAINGLGFQLEDKFSDELADIAQDKKKSKDYNEIRKDIEEYLADLNETIGGDLTLVPAMKQSRIVPRGKFYEEFVARYRGSGLIEDLRFEEVQNLGKTDPDRLVPAMISFYNTYPNTDYISSMVKTIFDGLQSGSFNIPGNQDVLWEMIIAYVKRYPTSPETNKLFSCNGDNVNLRNSPGIDGKLVGKITRDEILIQLEKSMDTTQVGDVRDYWYRVASIKGPKGWIFGKFLAPIDLSKYREKATDEKWTIDEHFADWSDSHTPLSWAHVPGSDPSGINFSMKGGKKIAELNSAKGSMTGLFSRSSAARAFSIVSRARFTGGDAFMIFAYVPAGDRAFYVRLGESSVDVSGRTIPLGTLEWHDYLLTSEDGRFASLFIDGQLVSSRIEPAHNKYFTTRGIYILHSPKEDNSRGEMEFVKVR
ncbi:MAG: SH3 domain-containing protein [Spirochaetes bacterium]|nr:SH3 domain-containing protein [Spirochaetota bacterium]